MTPSSTTASPTPAVSQHARRHRVATANAAMSSEIVADAVERWRMTPAPADQAVWRHPAHIRKDVRAAVLHGLLAARRAAHAEAEAAKHGQWRSACRTRPMRRNAVAIVHHLRRFRDRDDEQPLLEKVVGKSPPVVRHAQSEHTYIPNPFSLVRDLRSESLAMFDEPAAGGFEQLDMFSNLPEFAPDATSIVPCLPLVMFDRAGGISSARGRGAPLVLRLWIEALLSVDPSDRKNGTTRLSIGLRDLIAALWPSMWSGPKTDGPRLLAALTTINRTVVPWRQGEQSGYWAAVRVVNYPDVHNPKSELVLDVDFPPGSEVGPTVHRPMLRKYGVVSAPAFRAALGLAYLWNRYLTAQGKRFRPVVPDVERARSGAVVDANGEVVKSASGRPVRTWRHPDAVPTGRMVRNPMYDNMPVLRSPDLIALGAPQSNTANPSTRRVVLSKVVAALRLMESNGDLRLEQTRNGWRVEPPVWWGRSRGSAASSTAAGAAEPSTPRQATLLLGSSA